MIHSLMCLAAERRDREREGEREISGGHVMDIFINMFFFFFHPTPLFAG